MLTLDERNYLLTSMKKLLTKYDYPTTDAALSKIITEWYANKKHLIDAFKKHPHYLPGKFMIAFDSDYERTIDNSGSSKFYIWLSNNAMAQCKNNLPEEIMKRKLSFQHLPDEIFEFFYNLKFYAERCISEETAEHLNKIVPEIHAHAGQKTSRVVNKLCCYLGYDKVDGYNKAFAQYADSLSPMVIKRHTVLSLNPMDYFTMSFGNSWASCHTIDKRNKRDMPNSYEGQYSSGTMSYMLDPSSMVLYTISNFYDGAEYWDEPKITRQMFHWGEDKLIQGRLYPQDNDCAFNEYTVYRNVVQQIMSTIFEVPNLWTLKKGTDNASRYVYSYGTHYRDYNYYEGCSVSILKSSENTNAITIGADPICPKCGQRHGCADNISCCGGGGYYYCRHCGEEVEAEDAIEYDGNYYCSDCISWCSSCESYHFGEQHYISSEEIYVCNDCLDEFFVWCEDRREYVRKEDAEWVAEYNRYVHNDDLNIPRIKCSRCQEMHLETHMYTDSGRILCRSCHNRTLWYW